MIGEAYAVLSDPTKVCHPHDDQNLRSFYALLHYIFPALVLFSTTAIPSLLHVLLDMCVCVFVYLCIPSCSIKN
jgi:hypothetical protein